ncbi:hypothetical protein [Streptomyces sp. NPDC018031]|uniref:hypothetical protein n=1 Tax=Streptomyces sp. NPDC018031 TaxID=3365033 RepID=UPI00379A6DEB
MTKHEAPEVHAGRPAAFYVHLFFFPVFGGSLASSFRFGHSRPAMTVWAGPALVITAAPVIVWHRSARQEQRKPRTALDEGT